MSKTKPNVFLQQVFEFLLFRLISPLRIPDAHFMDHWTPERTSAPTSVLTKRVRNFIIVKNIFFKFVVWLMHLCLLDFPADFGCVENTSVPSSFYSEPSLDFGAGVVIRPEHQDGQTYSMDESDDRNKSSQSRDLLGSQGIPRRIPGAGKIGTYIFISRIFTGS